jgi:GntR family hexuronate regulon transcriptional repressor
VQHLENTKLMLFNETSDDFEFNADRYLFAENPVRSSRYRQRRKISGYLLSGAATCPAPG